MEIFFYLFGWLSNSTDAIFVLCLVLFFDNNLMCLPSVFR